MLNDVTRRPITHAIQDFIILVLLCMLLYYDLHSQPDGDDDYLGLSYLTVNTTCIENQVNQSCYSVIVTDSTIQRVADAFVSY